MFFFLRVLFCFYMGNIGLILGLTGKLWAEEMKEWCLSPLLYEHFTSHWRCSVWDCSSQDWMCATVSMCSRAFPSFFPTRIKAVLCKGCKASAVGRLWRGGSRTELPVRDWTAVRAQGGWQEVDTTCQIIQKIFLLLCYCLRKHNGQGLHTVKDGVQFLFQSYNPLVQLLASMLQLQH